MFVLAYRTAKKIVYINTIFDMTTSSPKQNCRNFQKINAETTKCLKFWHRSSFKVKRVDKFAFSSIGCQYIHLKKELTVILINAYILEHYKFLNLQIHHGFLYNE